MGASLEILSGIIRIGPDHEKFGDSYTKTLFISGSDGIVTFKGVTTDISVDEAHTIKKLLKRHGFTSMKNTRKKETKD